MSNGLPKVNILPVPKHINTSLFKIKECPKGYYRTFNRVFSLFLNLVWMDLYIEDRMTNEEDGTEGNYKTHINIYLGTKWFRLKTYRIPPFRKDCLDYFCSEEGGKFVPTFPTILFIC